MKMGTRPLIPRSYIQVPHNAYRHVVSYAFSRSKNTATACCSVIKALHREGSNLTRWSRVDPALVFWDETFCLERPDEAVVDHPLHGFTDAAGQGYWTVISRIAVILAWFGNGYYCGFLPGGRDLTGLPDIVKGTEENSEWWFRQVILKIGNAFCRIQLQCREIYWGSGVALPWRRADCTLHCYLFLSKILIFVSHGSALLEWTEVSNYVRMSYARRFELVSGLFHLLLLVLCLIVWWWIFPPPPLPLSLRTSFQTLLRGVRLYKYNILNIYGHLERTKTLCIRRCTQAFISTTYSLWSYWTKDKTRIQICTQTWTNRRSLCASSERLSIQIKPCTPPPPAPSRARGTSMHGHDCESRLSLWGFFPQRNGNMNRSQRWSCLTKVVIRSGPLKDPSVGGCIFV